MEKTKHSKITKKVKYLQHKKKIIINVWDKKRSITFGASYILNLINFVTLIFFSPTSNVTASVIEKI